MLSSRRWPIVAFASLHSQSSIWPFVCLRGHGTPTETKPLTDDQLAQIDRVQETYVELGSRFRASEASETAVE